MGNGMRSAPLTPLQVERLREALWHLDQAIEAVGRLDLLDLDMARNDLSIAIDHLDPRTEEDRG